MARASCSWTPTRRATSATRWAPTAGPPWGAAGRTGRRAGVDRSAENRKTRPRLYRRGIRQCIDVTYAITQRQTIWEYAPRSRAAEDYDAFVDFVRGAGDEPGEHAA